MKFPDIRPIFSPKNDTYPLLVEYLKKLEEQQKTMKDALAIVEWQISIIEERLKVTNRI